MSASKKLIKLGGCDPGIATKTVHRTLPGSLGGGDSNDSFM